MRKEGRYITDVDFYIGFHNEFLPERLFDKMDIKKLNVIQNAGKFWNIKKNKFNRGTIDNHLEFYGNLNNYMMDCGGFHWLNKMKEYPFTVEQYHEFLKSVPIDYGVSMDYMCESNVLPHMSIKERIEKTVLRLFDLSVIREEDDDANYTVLPVIQGYDPEDYWMCYDMIRELGFNYKYYGIGSVCRRSISKEIFYITNEIRRYLPDDVKLHGFGVKRLVLEKDLLYFDTMDSSSWVSYPRGSRIFDFDRKTMKVTPEKRAGQKDNHLITFLNYCEYIDLIRKNKKKHEVYLGGN